MVSTGLLARGFLAVGWLAVCQRPRLPLLWSRRLPPAKRGRHDYHHVDIRVRPCIVSHVNPLFPINYHFVACNFI